MLCLKTPVSIKDTHVSIIARKAIAARAPSGFPMTWTHQLSTVNLCYCHEVTLTPCSCHPPKPTAGTAAAEGRSTHTGMCSHREAIFSAEVLPGAAAHCLLPFLADATRQDLQVDSLTLKLVNLLQLLYLTMGKSSSDCLGNIYPIPCYGWSPLILVVSAPSGATCSLFLMNRLQKNLEIPFRMPFFT